MHFAACCVSVYSLSCPFSHIFILLDYHEEYIYLLPYVALYIYIYFEPLIFFRMDSLRDVLDFSPLEVLILDEADRCVLLVYCVLVFAVPHK